ncbi:restriction endonuclease subunit S [Helicobacter pylori]|uniref:restriction endonuclease subunit S n=3 Tax=Helicobacter pylori TaxID=210 RepID=UPI0035634363
MNHIEQLLQTLAPKGVEFRKLGEVCDFQKGKSITKKAVTFGKVPVISGGRQPAYYHNEANRSGETIAISSSGVYAGYVSYWDIPVFLADSFSVSPKQKTLMPKYLFHYLTTQQDAIHTTKSAGGIPHVYSKDLQNFLIPIPPLEIQQEIVKILDAFTELNTELNTELKARKKQYQYYQNMLLDFNDINLNHKDAKMSVKTYPKRLKTLLHTLAPKGVEFRKLGDIGEFYGGLVGKSKKSFSQGNKFYVPYVNVFNNPQLDLNALESVQIGDKEKQNTIQLGDVLFTGSSENLEDCAMSCVVTQKIEKDIYLNSFCFGFRFFDKNLFDPSFLKHFLRDYNFRKNISKVANGVTRFNVSKQLLSQITIPIPPLEIQQEIVKILDQFSILTTDLLAGIPAEIKARKKQYEYYREKLLTFKPLTPHKEVDKE